MVTKGIEPTYVLYFFEKICSIPHGSRNEAELCAYICDFAKERGLWCRSDELFNVVVKKPGTVGYESGAPLMLQAHIDMVCEKNNDTVHDFTKDPLKLKVDGDILSAEGTTLGGDNGIGAAMMLAALDSKDLAHPPLECVFTSQEEIGLIGANALDVSDLSAKTLINLDAGTEGEFIVSCAGGCRTEIRFAPEWETTPAGYVCCELSVKGLLGGHSGGDIILERANANILMARAIDQLAQDFGVRLVSINGGAMDNAIPRECSSKIACTSGDEQRVLAAIEQLQATYQKEYRHNEKTLSFTAKKCEAQSRVLADVTVNKIIPLLLLTPSGVLARSLEMEDLVETSNNVAVIKTKDDAIVIRLSSRSSVDSRKDFVIQRIKLLCRLLGVEPTFSGVYPGWEFAPNSRIRDVIKQAYLEQYGKEPLIKGSHGGLEPGILGSKIPGLDSVAMGPNLYGLHAPGEHASLSSLDRTWTLLKNVLGKLK